MHSQIMIFKTMGELELSGEIYRPQQEGLCPAVIVVHGGGWHKRVGDMRSVCRALSKAGFLAFNITYRLAPSSSFPTPVEDVKEAVQWVSDNASRLSVHPEQVAAWGYSAGANLVLLAGLDGDLGLRALVCGGTPANLQIWPRSKLVRQYLGLPKTAAQISGPEESRWLELSRQASPLFQVSAHSPPVFLYHGQLDQIVSVEQSRRLRDEIQRQDRTVELYEVPFSGHFSTYFLSQRSVQMGIEFLKRHMLK
jgi:acetyl esterase/lipase